MLNVDVSDSAVSDSAVTLFPASLTAERHRSSVSLAAQTDVFRDGVAPSKTVMHETVVHETVVHETVVHETVVHETVVNTSIAPDSTSLNASALNASEQPGCHLPAAITVATATYDPGQCETFLLLWAETDSLLASLETSASDSSDRA